MIHVVICNDKLFPFVFWQMLENFIQPLNYSNKTLVMVTQIWIKREHGGDSALDKQHL